ncbi:MAG: ATP-binding protein [Candidatus Aminicenantes bacterium]
MTDKEKIRALEQQIELLNREKKAILEANALESFEQQQQFRDKTKKFDEIILQLEDSQRQLKESEEKYRALFEQAVSSIILYDMETRQAVEFNDKAHENLGYTRAEFSELRIEDYEIDTSTEEIQNRIRQYRNKSRYSFATRHKRKDGQLRDVVIDSKCIHIHSKPYILCFITDITERKRSEVERKVLEKKLRQAQKMESIGTLAGGIAHDFNNILGIILGYAELVLLEAPDKLDTLKTNVRQLIQAVDRAKKLVKQILIFSHQGDETPKPLVVNSIIKEALGMLRSTLPTTINIQHYVQRETMTILGNPTEVQQILMNLCTNAAQAMQEKAGVLRVELKKVDSDTGISYMLLTVSDTGDGIPPDILERVFDPYFTTKNPGEGTGLGLSVVHGIVKRYGGDINIDTTPGKGTTVSVKIPLIELEVKPEEVLLLDIPIGNETILLVDDEEALLGTFQKILEQMNYTVITVDNSPGALEIFRKTPSRFHLVICDMTMPQMTGIQLAGELLSLRPDIPIILCTGFSEFIDARKAKAVGIKEFLMKPFSKRTLAATIRRVLDGK